VKIPMTPRGVEHTREVTNLRAEVE